MYSTCDHNYVNIYFIQSSSGASTALASCHFIEQFIWILFIWIQFIWILFPFPGGFYHTEPYDSLHTYNLAVQP